MIQSSRFSLMTDLPFMDILGIFQERISDVHQALYAKRRDRGHLRLCGACLAHRKASLYTSSTRKAIPLLYFRHEPSKPRPDLHKPRFV